MSAFGQPQVLQASAGACWAGASGARSSEPCGRPGQWWQWSAVERPLLAPNHTPACRRHVCHMSLRSRGASEQRRSYITRKPAHRRLCPTQHRPPHGLARWPEDRGARAGLQRQQAHGSVWAVQTRRLSSSQGAFAGKSGDQGAQHALSIPPVRALPPGPPPAPPLSVNWLHPSGLPSRHRPSPAAAAPRPQPKQAHPGWLRRTAPPSRSP